MRALLLCSLLAITACYSYRPAELATVPAGTSVRARISAAEAERVESLLGRSDARVLEGVLVQADGESFLIQVPTTARQAPGGGMEVLHQRLSVPRAGLVELELKQLNRPRTYGLVGFGVAAAAYLALQALNGDNGRDGPPNGGGDPEFRIPLVRFPR
ncbi:MAG: hypothetical protein ACRENP_01445 [Longimicrobiales bacterium]